ncbi:MAG: hypothetical protein WAQ22_04425 [Candidatus Saccharimonas sp.]
MTRDIFDDFDLEKLLKSQFHVDLEIDKVIARNIDASKAAQATVFLTKKKQLYCYIHGPSRLLLSDVKKLTSRIGVRPELFYPPKGQPRYFDDFGRRKFSEVFPGRQAVNDKDIIFYRTLAPYSPALALVSEVKDGHIYQADSDARSGWRVAAKFAYRRIRTS